jgi:uncharacterized Zn finger protein
MEIAEAECSCCGRMRPMRKLHRLRTNEPVFICRRCGLWVAITPRSTRH